MKETIDQHLKVRNEISGILHRIVSGLTMSQVLDSVYEEFQSFIPFHRMGCAVIEENGQIVRSVWARTTVEKIFLPVGYDAPLRGSSLENIVITGKTRIINDLNEYLSDHPDSDSTKLILKEGIRSSLTCPLINDGKAIGLLFFSSMNTDTYKDIHSELFLELAEYISVSLFKARAYEKLKEMNELKNRFLGIAAHDLRNPLAIIKSYVDILKTTGKNYTEEKRDGLLDRMDQVASRMFLLINDLLDISAIESGNLEIIRKPQKPSYLLDEAIEMCIPVAEKKQIVLTKSYADQIPFLPEISVDAGKIGQVLDNLLTNAVKFSESGTEIIINAVEDGGCVRFSIKDHGQGIPEEEISRLFQPFGKTSVRPTAGEKSTGLGLLIVRKIIEAHNGKIWVESKVGQGSEFIFTLPV
ncbi:MAG: GAF domain-containing sensor histidine kinase [Candidatus Riflebacteria bacterium]|nr:GAF domain-containing sensor histidine kinase [Candidatus Riflebacteria bacterium]